LSSVDDITTGLYLLASQALPSLCAQHHLAHDLPSDIYVPQYTHKQTKVLEAKRLKVLSTLLEQKGVSWWDVFESSEIGKERATIVSNFVPADSRVLDVGCGRGFFSFACTKKSRQVVSLDMMDGKERRGWWAEFQRTLRLLKVGRKVFGTRGSAASLPFRNGTFDVIASVHAIRNFQSVVELRAFIDEALRALKEGGRLILVESDFEAGDCRAYAEFYRLRTTIGWELRLPTSAELVKWLSRAGFTRISEEVVDTGLKYAPVYFPFDPALLKGMEREYKIAASLLKGKGERHPPISVITATR